MRAYSYHKNPEGLERGWWYSYVEDGRRSELYGPHDSRVLAGQATVRAAELAEAVKQEYDSE